MKILDEKKARWSKITAQITALDSERVKLEAEQKELIVELRDLLSKFDKEDTKLYNLEEATKIQKNKTVKPDLIVAEQDSDSDKSGSDSESDSDKKTLTLKKVNKPSGKSLKLKKPDSDSESDED